MRRLAFVFGHRRVFDRRIGRFYCFNRRHGIAFAAIVGRLGLKQDLLAAWSIVRGIANQRICSDRQEGVFARRDLSPLGDTGAGWDQLADYDILFEPDESINPALNSRLCQHPSGLLERGRR